MSAEKLLRNAAQVIRTTDFQPVSGIVNTALKRGQMVFLKADTTTHTPGVDKIAPNFELVLADTVAPGANLKARKAYFLERDVLSAVDYKARKEQEMRFLPEEVEQYATRITAEQVGACVAAREVLEIEVEGADFLHASVTGALTPGTELTLTAGKWALAATVAGAVAGRIVANIAPITAGNKRVRIEVL